MRSLAALLLVAACGPAHPATAAAPVSPPIAPDAAPTSPVIVPDAAAVPRWAGVTCGESVCSGATPICCREGGEHCAASATREGSCTDCDGPEDCAPGERCVNAALAPLGCTALLCCGTQECYDACRSDRDCDPCRPTCRNATPDRAGSCY